MSDEILWFPWFFMAKQLGQCVLLTTTNCKVSKRLQFGEFQLEFQAVLLIQVTHEKKTYEPSFDFFVKLVEASHPFWKIFGGDGFRNFDQPLVRADRNR